MRRIVFALLAASAIAAVSTSAAEASGGCGPGWHRTPWGACRPGDWGGYYGGPRYGYGWGWGHRWGYGGWHHGWHRHW